MRDRLERQPQAIRAMFAAVARRYDLLNRVLSLRRDVGWRRRLLSALAPATTGPLLDLATGTGDVALAARARPVVGADFCIDMLALARRKGMRRGVAVGWVVADALALPFRPGVFAAVTVAFGVRNFADLDLGLAEISRVLAPRGLVAILEFQQPRNPLMAALSAVWNRLVVTPLGRCLSDDAQAYAYLPASVATFPAAAELAERLALARLRVEGGENLSGGIAAVTTARREV